ncbi:MAG: RlpA-like double-psi beta-barrel domain-containing protein [Patescibacteria group bacterium]
MKHILKNSLALLLIFLFTTSQVQAAALRPELPGTMPSDWIVSESIASSSWPWYLEKLGPIYDFSLNASSSPVINASSSPLYLEMSYPKNNSYKKMYFLDGDIWRPLNTIDYPSESKVRAQFAYPSGKIAVFARPQILTSGTASWYKYKGGNFAASPDFKKGSVIRVYNNKNNKFVDVTINDYGPDRLKHPDRVVDLDKEAFKKIADTKEGLISVRIEPLSFSLYEDDFIKPSLSSEPQIYSVAAAIIKEADGQLLWGKNQDQVMPLASLTKIAAMKIFLDTKPDLKKVVAYKKQDEQMNYKYCKPGEAALLKLKDGETASINDFLYAALIGSANNAVETLVRVSGLKRDEFIKRMNDWVKKIGANHTIFIEPTGLAPQNMSSPLDYAIITKEAFKNATLQKISTTWKYQFSTRNTKKKHSLTNTNRLLDLSKYKFLGSKTGYLDEAGYCLMTRVATPKGNLIVVNFKATSSQKSFADNEQLINFGSRILNK